jgi:hypothetical protein
MMKKIIQQTTDYYLSKLPDNVLFYRPEDFANCDFPSFLVRRIRFDLERKLNMSIIPPRTEWINMTDEGVEKGWQRFLDTLQASTVAPANKMEPLLKRAVSDLFHILVEPRQTIPDLLFKEETKLSAEEIQKRVKYLVVYPHFGQVLVRYIKRKGRKKLSLMRCEKIIAIADEKITRDYSALQWGEMLRPLFELSNSAVNSDLICAFFKDRQMSDTAQKFEELNTELTHEVFVDTFFSFQEQPEKDHYIPEKTSHQNETKPKSLSAEHKPIEHKVTEEPSTDLQEDQKDNKHAAEQLEIEASDEDESVSEEQVEVEESREAEVSEVKDTVEEHADNSAEAEEQNQPSADVQPDSSKKQTETGQHFESNEEPASLNDIFTDESEQEEEKQPFDDETVANSRNRFSEPEDGVAEPPIWQRFVDSEDSFEVSQPTEKPTPQNVRERQNALEQYLQNNEDYFVETLFGGSTQAYRKSLGNISRQENWNEAYRIIDQQIFKPNRINMYSREAVDFTDRLQTYFLQMKNKH